MSFSTIQNANPTAEPQALAATNYFVAINQLSAHNAPETQAETAVSQPTSLETMLWPYLPYAPYALSAFLFLVVFSFMIMTKVRSIGNIVSALFLAILAGGIPSILNYVQVGSRQSVNAGPEEVPREVRVQKASTDSVAITWHTDANEIGVVKLSPSPFEGQTAQVYVPDNQQSIQSHDAIVSGLANNGSYEFEILSGHTWYDNGGSYIKFTFAKSP